MQCISLYQPYATLVVIGAKCFETRGWKTRHRGELGIHASSRFSEEFRTLCRQEPFRSVLFRAGYKHPSDLPLGAVIGTTSLEDCHPTELILPTLQDNPAELAFGDFRAGRWAWHLTNPLQLDERHSCRGHRGLFEAFFHKPLFT
jgi:hypothetical protein